MIKNNNVNVSDIPVSNLPVIEPSNGFSLGYSKEIIKDKAIHLSDPDIKTIINVLNVVGNGKYQSIIDKLVA